MNRINYIRQAEKKYHDLCYEQYKLFETGSWLYKPVKTVMDLISLEGQNNLQVLDLGSMLEEIAFLLHNRYKILVALLHV